MTYPPDYSQQLYAYLQAWRQFLEPLTAMAAMAAGMAVPPGPWAGPGGYPIPAPGLPPYPTAYPAQPPSPPAAPVSPAQVPAADYTQQLFGYLQGWRQQLEQMTGTATPTTYGNDAGTPGRRPVPPDPADAGRTSPPDDGPGSLYPRQSTTSSVPPPKFEAMRPANQSGSQVPGEAPALSPQFQRDSLRQPAVVARGPQIDMAPIAELGRMRQRDVGAPRATGTPITRVATPTAAVRAMPQSNYLGLVTRALRNVERG
ncbi:hypothetical protein A5719_28610 [Mycolicibacterium peregrinum]|nr:hypothetical protein [Mycolicibacterium peregrinum]OBF32593.1 hypothetical protein A5719_28610 [Mycolicibacterium peregrinum]